MHIQFLNRPQVLYLHEDLIGRYGGTGGIRDRGLLESAVAMPSAMSGGEHRHAGLFEVAGAYLFHIVRNHPFLDGNKRTGAAAAIIFLALNEIQIEDDQEGLVELTLAVAAGRATKAEAGEFFRSRQL